MTDDKLEIAGYDPTATRATNFEGKHIIRVILTRELTNHERIHVEDYSFNRLQGNGLEILVADLANIAAVVAESNEKLAQLETAGLEEAAASKRRAEQQRREAEDRNAKFSAALDASGLRPIPPPDGASRHW